MGASLAHPTSDTDNGLMPSTPWRKRIDRAEKLAEKNGFAGEILGFYVAITRFQEDLWLRLQEAAISRESLNFQQPVWPGLVHHFPAFLSVAEGYGPATTVAAARELQSRSDEFFSDKLNEFWSGETENSTGEFFWRAFLQPYGELVRSRTRLERAPHTPCTCPYCGRKPGAGVLRPLGDGGQRYLLCSFCLAEWEFRRIVCPSCGEEDHAKLPVYRAEGFDHVRVECCEKCKTYLKTVDLTKDGLAEPVVDEIASVPLDLWAQEQGYSKLQTNVMEL
jgi:FdhE protein